MSCSTVAEAIAPFNPDPPRPGAVEARNPPAVRQP
jgi:hypothetical protein